MWSDFINVPYIPGKGWIFLSCWVPCFLVCSKSTLFKISNPHWCSVYWENYVEMSHYDGLLTSFCGFVNFYSMYFEVVFCRAYKSETRKSPSEIWLLSFYAWWYFLLSMHATSLHCIWLFASLWTIACQAPSVRGILQAGILTWPCPPPGDLPNPEIEPVSLMSSALPVGSFPLAPFGSHPPTFFFFFFAFNSDIMSLCQLCFG